MKKKSLDKPFLLHVKPTSSDDSIELQHVPLDCKPLIGCAQGQSGGLLFPAVLLVPSISGVSKMKVCQLVHINDTGCCGRMSVVILAFADN